jgi:hypothetical protein
MPIAESICRPQARPRAGLFLAAKCDRRATKSRRPSDRSEGLGRECVEGSSPGEVVGLEPDIQGHCRPLWHAASLTRCSRTWCAPAWRVCSGCRRYGEDKTRAPADHRGRPEGDRGMTSWNKGPSHRVVGRRGALPPQSPLTAAESPLWHNLGAFSFAQLTPSNRHSSIHGVMKAPNRARTQDSCPCGVRRSSVSTITPVVPQRTCGGL